MNSKSVGADLVYAWSGAKIGAMDSTLAAKIMYPEAGADEIKQKAADYEKLQVFCRICCCKRICGSSILSGRYQKIPCSCF